MYQGFSFVKSPEGFVLHSPITSALCMLYCESMLVMIALKHHKTLNYQRDSIMSAVLSLPRGSNERTHCNSEE